MSNRIRLAALLAASTLLAISFALPSVMGANQSTQAKRQTKPEPVRLLLSDARGKVGMTVSLTARLLDARTSEPIKNRRIGFGCTFDTPEPILTDEKGFAHYEMELREGTECGESQITAAFPGDSSYESAWATATLTVVKGPSYLWVADRTGRAGTPVTLTAKLTNGSDKPIEGGNVRFKLGGRMVGTFPTGSDGFVSAVVITGPVPGAYPISVVFEGDDGHEGARASGTLRLR